MPYAGIHQWQQIRVESMQRNSLALQSKVSFSLRQYSRNAAWLNIFSWASLVTKRIKIEPKKLEKKRTKFILRPYVKYAFHYIDCLHSHTIIWIYPTVNFTKIVECERWVQKFNYSNMWTMTVTGPIFMRFILAWYIFLGNSYSEFHENRRKNVKSEGRNPITPICEVWPSLGLFSWDSYLLDTFF
jgi:hypothetical protein